MNRPKKYLCDLSQASVRVYPNGEIEETYLESLKEYGFLNDIAGINRIEDLYGRFESIDTDVDYSELKRCIEVHKFNITLRNKVLKLIPLAMLYSETTLPKYGYMRAKSFIRTFNKEYDLNMDMDELDEIMNIDYSNIVEVKRLIKKKD